MKANKLFHVLSIIVILSLFLLPVPAAQAAPGDTTRVSVASEGTQANNESGPNESGSPAISADGRYVAFASYASNLVSADTNGFQDVFVRDRLEEETTRVSVASNGAQANGNSFWPATSPDGRYVAFASWGSNLVSGDTNEWFDIFVHDRLSGETTRVSVASDGTQSNASSLSSSPPSISADGRYVAFSSDANNLVSGDTNGKIDAFLHDRLSGETVRVSVGPGGAQANDESGAGAMSADGRYLAFDSGASNLVSGDLNERSDIFVYDRLSGAVTLVSVASNGIQEDGYALAPSISGDGRYVSFLSNATNLVSGDTNEMYDVFVHDRLSGETSRVSVASDGTQANGHSYYPIISADGRYVSFSSDATDLVSGDTNGVMDVFLHDRVSGETTRVSVASAGTQANESSSFVSLSANGRYVSFISLASNLVSGDTNDAEDVFVHENSISPILTIAGNAGVAGATLEYGVYRTATADGTGSYSFQVPYGWSGTVTPSKSGYRFDPDHKEYTNITTDWTGQDYTATNYWAATPWYGSLSVSSDRSVVAVARPHVGAEVASYNGVPTGSLTAYVPMLFKNAWGSYDSALYIQNVDPAHSASITIKFYDSNGDLSCEISDSVAPLASKGFWVPAQSCLPAGWVGGAVVSSDWPIVAVGRPHIGSEVMTYNGFGSGAWDAYLPMLFKNAWGSYDSAFYVQNVEETDPASVTMKFYNSDGSLSCTLDDLVPPMASKGYWIPAQSCLPDGWVGGVVMESDRQIVTVARLHIGSQITTYPGFASGGSSMYVPMLFKNAWGSYDSAFYVQNLDPVDSAGITIKFYDSAGSLTCELADSLPALASKGYWVPAQSCLPDGWVGGAVVSANRNIVAVGRPHVGAQVTTYPGIAGGNTSLYLPMLFKNMWGSYNSAFYVQNTDPLEAANVTLKFYDTEGNLSCTRSDSIPAKATLGYWVPSVECEAVP